MANIVKGLVLVGLLFVLPVTARGVEQEEKVGALGKAFGVEMAVFLSSLGQATEVEDGLYKVSGVPSPHPEFTDYLVAWTPEAGVCAVIAFGQRNEGDSFGTTTRGELETVSADLTATFGEPVTIDEVREKTPLALWSQELLEGKRDFARVWRAPASGRGDGIRAVALSAVGYMGQAAGLAIEYRFENEEACKQSLEVGLKGYDLGAVSPPGAPVALKAVGEQQELTAAVLRWFSSMPESPAARRPDLERLALASCMADVMVKLSASEKESILSATSEELTGLVTEVASANPTLPWRDCR